MTADEIRTVLARAEDDAVNLGTPSRRPLRHLATGRLLSAFAVADGSSSVSYISTLIRRELSRRFGVAIDDVQSAWQAMGNELLNILRNHTEAGDAVDLFSVMRELDNARPDNAGTADALSSDVANSMWRTIQDEGFSVSLIGYDSEREVYSFDYSLRD